MAFQYHIHCPYCDHLLETTTKLSPHSGRLVKTCPLCTKPYADPYGEEVALAQYQSPSVLKRLIEALSTAFGFALIVCAGVWFVTGHDSFTITALFVCTALFLVLDLLHSLLTRRKRRQKQQDAWQESDRRLRDLSYATLLKQVGYYVPGRYLPSTALDIEPEPFSVKPVRIVQSVKTPHSRSN